MQDKKYFIIKNKTQLGPFSIDELKTQNITRTTPIWHEGLKEWTTVNELSELSEVFKSTPPAFKTKIFQFNKSCVQVISATRTFFRKNT